MAHKVIMPKAGQTMEEGTIVQWLKNEGDAIGKGDALMVVQTDKADLEVEASEGGILTRILVPAGDTVPVLTTVAVVTAPGETLDIDVFLAQGDTPPVAASADAPAPAAPAAPAAGPPAASASAAPRATPTARNVAAAAGKDLSRIKGTGVSGRITKADVMAAPESGRLHASPYARKLAAARGVDLAALTPTGPGGRILARDVEVHRAAAPAAAPSPAPCAGPPAQAEVVELTGMRKAIAGALQLSKQKAPHFYAAMDVDMSRAMAFKDYLKETGRKVTVNDLVLRAAVLALQAHPRVNCRVEDTRVTYLPAVNLGVAVGLEAGLVVPVVRDAGALPLEALAAETRRIVDLARAGTLVGTGQGSFTVTNLGMFGVASFSAIINPPEGGILAVGAVRDTVGVKGQAFFLTRVMTLTISVDHRVIDGVLAAAFLRTIKELLENPERLG